MQQDIDRLKEWLASKIVGQEHLVERLMIALLADGHLLVEGAPGLAKTKAIKTLSEGMEADFHRVQFTPDLLPADITGSDIYRPQKGTFEFQAGPLFHNLVLADEINRAPAKVQSALLEAMAERQISVGKNTYPLPELFLVMATQNPIEQEGTYPLPEAQMDRFLMHVLVDYPAPEAERAILALSRQEALNEPTTKVEPLTQKSLFNARKQVNKIHMSEAVEEYLVQLILATRNSTAYSGELGQWLDYGASPRATIALDKCSRALAWMEGRDFVTPDDIRAVAHDVLRHRLILSFEAEAGGINANQVIDKLLETVPRHKTQPMSMIDNDQEHPATASLSEMIRLRYGARELTGFPKIQARQMLAGGHKSRFRGRGMDFDQVRIYQPGDDVRSIDWRVTARTEVPHTKIFSEERERPILVISDLRSSMFFGSQRLKSVVACEISAALAWAGLAANDRAGGLIFGQQEQMDVKARRSHHAVLQFIHGLQEYSTKLLDIQQTEGPQPDLYSLAEILEEARRFVLPGSTIFIVSDFHDLNDDCERHVFELARHGNLNFCQVFDDIEQQLPPPSLYAVSDGQRQTLLDTSNKKLRERFQLAYAERGLRLRKMSEKLSAGLLPFNTSDNVMSVLHKAYGKRRTQARGN